jgi:hypothetical protein
MCNPKLHCPTCFVISMLAIETRSENFHEGMSSLL